jgi:hypothetical protein
MLPQKYHTSRITALLKHLTPLASLRYPYNEHCEETVMSHPDPPYLNTHEHYPER